MGVQSVIFEIIHESLMNKDTELSVSALCEIAGVSRSGYYRWVSAEDARNRREQQDRADFAPAPHGNCHESKEDTAVDAEIQLVLSVP